MIRATTIMAAMAAYAGAVHADTTDDARTEATPPEQLVLLNATGKLGDVGSVDKIRRVLDTRGMLLALPDGIAATLDGRAAQIADVDAIKDAVTNENYDVAIKLIEENEARLLQNVAGDPMPALAELSQWRGLIASGQDDKEAAIHWFRGALRFNPAASLDKSVATPKVLRLVKKAKREADEFGTLRIDADPATATVEIDGGKPQPITERLALPVGPHLVTVTAAGRTTYAELVEIAADKPTKIAITLDPETRSDRAARLVDATVAAPPGQARLKRVRGVSRFVGATRFLVIEDSESDRMLVRVYDVDAQKVSRQIDVEGTASSAAITRKVMAALDADRMVDANTVMVITKTAERRQRWYERWYVWAGIGAVIGGGALTYHYMAREPTTVRL